MSQSHRSITTQLSTTRETGIMGKKTKKKGKKGKPVKTAK